jgi:tetratricopeptide (TPR) repeat protein
VAIYRKLLEITPSFTYGYFLLALALTQERKYEEALAALQKVQNWGGARSGVLGLSGHIHAALGRDDEAREMLAALHGSASEGQPSGFPRAVIHVALGEAGPALDLLEQAHDQRDKQVRLLRVEPLLDPIRTEPRFHTLLERLGLTDDAVARALAP